MEMGLSGDYLSDPHRVPSSFEDFETFGRKTTRDEYDYPDIDEQPRKRVRIRVPVVRSRSARQQHALTVVRKRPIAVHTRPRDWEPIISSPTARRVVVRTRVRSYDIPEYGYDDNYDYDASTADRYPKTGKHKVTITRRRKLQPSKVSTTAYRRERITRKKLVNIRPIPTPTPTLAIITTGFYTAAPVTEDDYYYEDKKENSEYIFPNIYGDIPNVDIRTPVLEENPTLIDNYPTIELPPIPETKSTQQIEDYPTVQNHPVIITDNFFLPPAVNDDDNIEVEDVIKNDKQEEFVEPTTLKMQDEETTEKTIEEQTEMITEIPLSDKLNYTLIDSDIITIQPSDDYETTTMMDDITTVPTAETSEENVDISTKADMDTHVVDTHVKNSTTESVISDLVSVNITNVESSSSTQSLTSTIETTKTVKELTSSVSMNTTTPIKKTIIPTSTSEMQNITTRDPEDSLRVIPIQTTSMTETLSSSSMIDVTQGGDDDIPSVVPLGASSDIVKSTTTTEIRPTSVTSSQITTLTSPTPEDIEGGLADDLYLSLSRPDFPEILPSKAETNTLLSSGSSEATPILQTSVYYSETTVTSTRLRTYTYVVTKLNGLETEVTSSTTVRPRVTTLTLTVPKTVTMTVTPTAVLSSPMYSSSVVQPSHHAEEDVEEEGRKLNLATRIMSNGVEVIVAGPTPALRWDNSNSQPTLTLSDAVVMLLPQEKPNDFVTKTCMTTFTYLNTITKDGMTIVSTDQQVIANTATEERHRKPGSEVASVTLEASPTLHTEVFKTTYTYITLNTDHPDQNDALESSTRVIMNTVTAPQYYLDMFLEPSEVPRPETNTYLSTRLIEKTIMDDGRTTIETISNTVKQLIITESVPPPRPTSVTKSLTALDEIVTPTPEPIQIFATKTYLTTYTFFTTLVQPGPDGGASTTISTRSQIVENVVTESIAPSLLDAGYMNALLTSSHHSDSVKNVVTGSTIIFFDDEDQIDPTTTLSHENPSTATVDKIESSENESATKVPLDAVASETNEVTSRPVEPDASFVPDEPVADEPSDPVPSKRPSSQVSNLLSLGSLGINSLSALGPVITAMAGLLQGKTATRRNDSESVTEPPGTTTQRSPIYIPVAEFADGDIETAESQNIGVHLGNHNHLPETRHKVTSSLVDGIPISPGEIITANSDVIIGKPGKMGPRPPYTFLKEDENIGMKPPPKPVPNIQVHPVLEVLDDEQHDLPKTGGKVQSDHQLEILPAHQVYEEHIQIPIGPHQSENVHYVSSQKNPGYQIPPPKRISSKHDILLNDPLLKPPARPKIDQYPLLSINHHDNYNHNIDRNKRPWNPKDSVIQEDLHHQNWTEHNESQLDVLSAADVQNNRPLIPEQIIHQVPHVIDRSTGQPLLVNIQPSQVANVVIPQGGTQALIFGDTNEPHISGQYFDDPSPYPETEVGPGFMAISKIENHPQVTQEADPAEYMMPPSPPKSYKPLSHKQVSKRPHIIPLSQGAHDFTKDHISAISRPEKIAIRHPEGASGQGHVHTEILVHHRPESVNLRPQPSSRPPIPTHGYSNIQFPPRREHVNTQVPIDNTPPRRTEVPLSMEITPYDPVKLAPPTNNWKADKKPHRIVPPRWQRPPTSRPRQPTRMTRRPIYGRPVIVDRPIHPPPIHRQPPFTNLQRVPLNPPVQPEFDLNRPLFNINHSPDQIQQHVTDKVPITVTEGSTTMKSTSTHVPIQNKYPHYQHDILHSETINESNTDVENDHDQEKFSPESTDYHEEEEEFEHDTTKEDEKKTDSESSASEDVHVMSESEDEDTEDEKYIIGSHDEHPGTWVINATETSDEYIKTEKINPSNTEKPVTPMESSIEDISEDMEDIITDNENKKNQLNGHARPILPGDINDDMYNVQVQPVDYNFGNIRTSSSRPFNKVNIGLKPPGAIQVSEPNGHSRPYIKTQIIVAKPSGKPTPFSNPEIITKSPEKDQIHDQGVNILKGHIRPGLGQVIQVENDNGQSPPHKDSNILTSRNETKLYNNRRRLRPDQTIRIHAGYPQIITKQKPKVPNPVIISTGKINKSSDTRRRPSVQFSLPIDATGDEKDSNTQTERPPSSDIVRKPLHKEETLDTAFQTNFATSDSKDDKIEDQEIAISMHSVEVIDRMSPPKSKIPSQSMMPPPIMTNNKELIKKDGLDEGLRPPPQSTDVLGMSPPPVDITTTHNPTENHHVITSKVTGLKPPPIYIPLNDKSNNAPLPPSGNMVPPPSRQPMPSATMVPPTPRPSTARPYLAEILSQDMAPPPPVGKTTGPIEIATIRPAVAVSGSMQIANAVATSHIPVIHDMESKIPIVHGTVDLPVVVDVPEILKPVESRKPDHVSIYTIRPFETKPLTRTQIRPTEVPSTMMAPTKIRPSQVHRSGYSTMISHNFDMTKLSLPKASKKSSSSTDFHMFIEPSTEILPSSRMEPTEFLTSTTISKMKPRPTLFKDAISKTLKPLRTQTSKYLPKNNKDSSEMHDIDYKLKNPISKTDYSIKPTTLSVMKEIAGTVIHEIIQNSTTSKTDIQPKEVTRFETLTVTRTETSVVGSPPTTRTLLITHTLTSTRIETVTETLLRPTKVISTVTSTVLQSVTHMPPQYENPNDNDSIFVVMTDQKPPEHGAEEVEAEYGEDEVSRDEQDPVGNEIQRVLAGGVLGAPSIPIHPPKNQCIPECKSYKSEICSESGGELRCVCRPGFARMFPDRPCKPTYTYTVGVGLDRIGRDRISTDLHLNDTSSASYLRLMHPVKEALDRTLMQSDLRDLYRNVNIAGFTQDPTRVLFHVQLSDNADETRLKEVIRKYLISSNYSLGGTEVYASRDLGLVDASDFNECEAETGGPYHDCSPNAECFNMKGTYQCSCKESWADLSENPSYPGRHCSQVPLGCAACNNKGHCVVNSHGHEVCECFPWHSGQKCQVNLKVLLIALVTTGAILLGLLAVCVGLACFRHPGRRRSSGDRRAMIPGTGCDTSSEGSVAELAIPHHVPHVLPPPPQMVAPVPPIKRPARKISSKLTQASKKPTPVIAAMTTNTTGGGNEQRDRSLTVMIPRAKYRSAPQSSTPQNYKPVMSSFAVEEHKLIDYLDGGAHPGNRKPSLISNNDYGKDIEVRNLKQAATYTQTGALVSAGFQVSATVSRPLDAESTLARSCGETTVEPATKLIRSSDYQSDLDSTLVHSCSETVIQATTKQLMRLDLGEAGSTLARSCGETTIQPSTKIASADRKDYNRDARDSASEGHTMAERDLGSTLRLPAQHAPLYKSDRGTSDRESNFDSL